MCAPFFQKPTVAVVLGLVLCALCAPAAETDNFYLPLAPEFADFGDYLENVHMRALENAVEEVNGRIERALKIKDPAAQARQLVQFHTADAITRAVAAQFGHAPTETFRIESVVSGMWAQHTFPNKTLVHFDISMNVRGHFLFDPSALFTLFQAGTIKASGVYFGTDKLLHFHQLGYAYYQRYRGLLKDGAESAEASRKVIKHFATDGLWAEANLFGSATTRIYSNADLAANYAGFKFFLNLTDKVVWRGAELEPLVVRSGVFWRVNDQVRPRSGWFSAFISDHWNEALNPSLYSSTMRPRIRRILQSRARRIAEFYTGNDHRPLDPAYFDDLAHSLATYDGEPYGHSGQFEKLMHIGNTCLPALPDGKTPQLEAKVRRIKQPPEQN